ncbi:MAG: hypothetical protein LUD15_01155 [Bacteroides sp.]|nr:hypothetical protein [Bacteroides sp.]
MKRFNAGSMNSHIRETSYNNRYFSEKYYYSGKSNTPTSMHIVWYNPGMIDSERIDPGSPFLPPFCGMIVSTG